MTGNESWIYQGRQTHGWFGHGTSPHDDGEDEADDGTADDADPLFQPANAARRVDYVAHCLVALVPRRERSRWNGAADPALREDLKTAVGAWYAGSGLDRDAFRARFFGPHTDEGTIDRLRAAARGIVGARSHRALGVAAGDLADAAQQLGPFGWSRFVAQAAGQAVAAVADGTVPGARLMEAAWPGYAAAGMTTAAGAGAAGPVLAPMGRILTTVLEATPEIAVATVAAVAVAWLAKNGPVSQVPVLGFGPLDHGMAPVSAQVNTRTNTVLLYHGTPGQMPDTAMQHTVELRLSADGVLTDREGRAVGRFEPDQHRVVPFAGVDIPGLFHGPAATPPQGQQPGETLPPSPGTSPTSEADRKALGQPETLPAAPPLPGPAATPVPAQPKGADVLPGREIAPEGPQVVTMAIPTPRDGVMGGKPTGTPEPIKPRANAKNQEGLRLQQESEDAMAAAGYRVERQPKVRPEDGTDPMRKPDSRIGGNIMDVVAPLTSNPDQVRNAISDKVAAQQAYHIVLNLGRTSVTRGDVESIIARKPIRGLKELFVHEKNGAITRILPEPEQISPPYK